MQEKNYFFTEVDDLSRDRQDFRHARSDDEVAPLPACLFLAILVVLGDLETS